MAGVVGRAPFTVFSTWAGVNYLDVVWARACTRGCKLGGECMWSLRNVIKIFVSYGKLISRLTGSLSVVRRGLRSAGKFHSLRGVD